MADTHFPFKTTPYKHQLEVWEKSKDKTMWALFMDMGTGKTKVIIDTIAYLYNEKKITGALIVAPKGCYRDWTNHDAGQLVTHMPEHIPYYATYWSAYNTKAQMLSYDKLFLNDNKLHIFVVNVEAIATESCRKVIHKFVGTHITFMCVDESTTIKNRTAQRTKAAISLGQLVKYRRILTGMPVTQSPMDLFSQCGYLHPQLLGFASYFAFRNRYAIMQKMYMGTRSFDKIIGYQRLEELTHKLNSFSSRVTKDECLDLPEKIYMYREVELTKEQQKFYRDMKTSALVLLEEAKIITAAMAMNQIMMLHQIVSGFISDPSTGEITTLPNNRVQETLDILEEVTGKVIIWACYRKNIHDLYSAIQKKFGPETVATYYGDTRSEDREQSKANFQNPDHPLRFFVINPATGKFGLTLTEAKTVIYYTNDYDLEKRIQSEDRAHRIGQTDNVLYIDLVTPSTVDEKIIKTLKAKKNISDIIMGEAGLREWLQ